MQTISVVECYRAVKYFDLLSDFDKKLGNIIDDVWGEKIDYSEIVKIVSIALDQIHLPCFVTEFDLWYKKMRAPVIKIFSKPQKDNGSLRPKCHQSSFQKWPRQYVKAH